MLKLRRIELVGFKSFSDRGQIVVNESGITAIVGPNGCGKSNVSDALAWVLGEQSAKSLRGEKMEDVIFNGTRHRAPMGMAEVTITLTDTNGAGGNGNGAHAPGPRDIIVQRRLYRSGESLYLIDGRPCRLRDIQDIFLGTGLGPNSYAIIEQGRVGQLLSSKPLERRALIEEAAGVTKFKAKRKLAESRLEAARQNLSRVNDILTEVDRQRNSLKRQAGKARRYIEMRNRMRDILGAVFSTRAEMMIHQQEAVEAALASIEDEGRRLEADIERLDGHVHQRRSEVESAEEALEAVRRRHADVGLEYEKTVQRIERFEDQVRSLDERKAALSEELARATADLARNLNDQNGRAAQVAELDQTRQGVAGSIEQMREVMTGLTAERSSVESAIDQLRRKQFEMVGEEARIRNEIGSRQEMIERISAQIGRLEREAAEAHELASAIQLQLDEAKTQLSGRQAGMSQVKAQLAQTEEQCARIKNDHAEAVKALAAAKSAEDAIRNRLHAIGELSTRRAYSTESIQQFFNHVRSLDWSPLGMIADFIEVDPGYESIVEDVLRSELQYVVVEDRSLAERALAVVKEVTKGRLECLVLTPDAAPRIPAQLEDISGAVPLSSVVRLDERLHHLADRLLDGYIVETVEQAWELAGRYPDRRFVARTGEVVRGPIVSWGEHEAHGPLSLRREIRELDRSMDRATQETAGLEAKAATLAEEGLVAEQLRSRLSAELQEIEKTILTTDHRVQALASDWAHAEQRRRVASAEIERLTEERTELADAVRAAAGRLDAIAAAKKSMDEEIAQRSLRIEALRVEVEITRHQLAEIQARLAVLEERRSTASKELNTLRQQAADLEDRSRRASLQIRQAEEQQSQTHGLIRDLEETRDRLAGERDSLAAAITDATHGLESLRRDLHDAEHKWDESRAALDAWKDRHNTLEIERTQVDSDLKHLSTSCWNELNETIESVCLKYFQTLAPEGLEQREQEYRELRERMDSMGGVNMMAVDEYQEAEQRFEFLNGQRQDLLDSIRDTSQAIDEIDSVCRKQFKDAFEAINAGFKDSFVRLFGGGHGELRLLEEASEADAGVEIVAQPPGKKLQNVLLLSGGEKALAALALLIALFQFKPSPFCVLDEVDAPLDDANVDRFAQLVRQLSEQTQFIVITHSKRTMETASALYGVTMEEPGVSKIVSVRLN